MGNKTSANPEHRQSVQERVPSPDLLNPSLTSEAVEKLETCLQNFPLDINDAQRESLIRSVAIKHFTTPETILKKGEETQGIYIVVSGRVQVVSENEAFVLREVSEGDYFGEVSVLFKTKCTADVRVDSRCELLLIKANLIEDLFSSPPDISLFHWFVQRKYIDTSQLFEKHSVAREITQKSIKEAPMFQGWSSQAIEALLGTWNDGPVVLYQMNSPIYLEGDSGREAFLLVSGRIRFSTGELELAIFDAGEEGFCFGEEGLFVNCLRRSTVRAVTPCQIVTLSMENLYDVMNMYGTESSLFQDMQNQWRQTVKQRNAELYMKYGGAFDVEILRMALKRTLPFGECPSGFLSVLALAMKIAELQPKETVLTEDEYGSTLFMVLHGSVVIMDGLVETEHVIEAKEIFWKTDDMSERGWAQTVQQSVVAKFPVSTIRKAQEAFPLANVHKP